MKKLVSIVLALALIMVVAVASANTITIESNAPAGATNNTTYTWYQILKASYEGTLTTTTPVSYYVDSPASDTLAGLLNAIEGITATKSADDTRWNITVADTFTGVTLAAALNTDAIKAAAIDTGSEDASGNSDVVIDGLDDGYYLIVASNGQNLIAQTLGDVTNSKNSMVDIQNGLNLVRLL